MTVELLTEHQLEFLSLMEAVEARLSPHLSKYHINGNLMSRLISNTVSTENVKLCY